MRLTDRSSCIRSHSGAASGSQTTVQDGSKNKEEEPVMYMEDVVAMFSQGRRDSPDWVIAKEKDRAIADGSGSGGHINSTDDPCVVSDADIEDVE